MKKIVIDPGHGGSDPGAVGPSGLLEKDVAWRIACRVADLLERYGITVILTRNGDERVSLDKRIEIANNSIADYFVSIHINSAKNNTATGTETYAYAKGVEGDKLAHSIQSNLVKVIGLADRGVKYNSLQVIRETKMPGVLAEVAFINNPNEEKLLKSDEFLERAAVGIAKGILEHLKIYFMPRPKEEVAMDNKNTVSNWAKEAMEWATSKEVGLTDGTNPKEPLTLERFITILHRYDNLKK